MNDIMENVDLGWDKVAGAQKIPGIVDSLIKSFDLIRPEKTVSGLVRLKKELMQLPNSFLEKNQKLNEVTELIIQCSGLFADATSNEAFAIKSDSIRINFAFNNRLGTPITLKNVNLRFGNTLKDTSVNRILEKNKNLNITRTYYVDPTTPETSLSSS